MSQQRSDAGSNKRVVVLLIIIVVLGGVYAALSGALGSFRDVVSDQPGGDPAAWEHQAPEAGSATSAVAEEAVGDVATHQLVAETAALHEQLQREQASSDAQPQAPSEGASPAHEPATNSTGTLSLDYSTLDPATRQMMELKRVLEVANTSLQVQQAQAAIEETRRQTEGVRLGTNAIPMLVGVSGSPSRGLRAEFHLGGSQRVALVPGRWITPNWKLVAVDAAGAEVENVKGERTRLVLGTRPVQSQSQSQSQQQPASAMPPMVPVATR